MGKWKLVDDILGPLLVFGMLIGFVLMIHGCVKNKADKKCFETTKDERCFR